MTECIIRLPFGIEVVQSGRGATIQSSGLRAHLSSETADRSASIASSTIESMILSFAANGYDIGSTKFLAAIEDVVEAVGNHLDDLDDLNAEFINPDQATTKMRT